jgi:hypothetical protein
MIVHSALAIVGLAASLAVLLMNPSTAALLPNLVQVMPRRWKLWMLGETPNGKTSRRDDIVM